MEILGLDENEERSRPYVQFHEASEGERNDLPGEEIGGEQEQQQQQESSVRCYVALLLASLISLGAHVCLHMPSSVEKDLLERLGINNEQYGDLNSASSWASLAGMPFIAGMIVDRFPTRFSVVVFCFIVAAGQLLFALGVASRSFAMAMAGRALFGVGESTVMVAQGVLVVQWFRSRQQLAVAIGVTETAHNLANMLGKESYHAGLAWGRWEATLWLGLSLCLFSLLVAVAYFVLEMCSDPAEFIARKTVPLFTELGGLRQLSVVFLLLLHSNVEHLFDSISAKFIFEKWGIDWTDAVWVSGINYALPIVLSPVIGHMLDRVPNRMLIASFACATMAAGHVILGFFPWTPVVGMLVLAVALSVLPTILRSSVPVVVPHGVSGVAFGMYIVAENFGKVVGNPLIGYFKDITGDFILDEQIFVSMSALAVLLCGVIALLDWKGARVLCRRRTATSIPVRRISIDTEVL